MDGGGAAPTTSGRADPRRDPAALAAAIDRRWRRYRFRAYLFGVLVGFVATVPIVIATTVLVLGLALLGADLSEPWPELVWTIAFVVLFAAAGSWAVARWLPRPFRSALESYVWLAMRAEAHWVEAVGSAVPRKPEAMRAFLDSATVTSSTAAEVASIWLALGDLDTARQVLESMPTTTDAERHQKAEMAWLADFVGGTDTPLGALEGTATAIADVRDRLEAQVGLAVDASRLAIAHGGDWIAPLAAVRPALGAEPSAMLWQIAFWPTARMMLLYGGVGVAAYWVFTVVI